MAEWKKLPIGIEDFEKIRKENFYYIDKTGLIRELLENWGEVNLFTRPRRFGKSLNMSMMKKIRWGIAGPGVIANKFAKAIKNVDGAELVAVASRTEENGKAFADKYGIANVFCGYEKMAESNIIDAVYIATPHPFHKSCAELFMNAGKHILCEKPLCVNAFQAKKLKECAERNGVFLMEAMWSRFLPAIIEAQKIVKRGDIGEILGVEADFCYTMEPHEDPKVFQNELAGGSLLDVGVYGLHFASTFLGNSPEDVVALANVKDGVDIHTNVLLKSMENMGVMVDASGVEHKLGALTQEQADELVALIESTTKLADYSDSVIEIVIEQAAAYFDGQKSAQDVAKLVQSKVNIYVNEQR